MLGALKVMISGFKDDVCDKIAPKKENSDMQGLQLGVKSQVSYTTSTDRLAMLTLQFSSPILSQTLPNFMSAMGLIENTK